MSEEEGLEFNPYEEWKTQVYTWLLCWKRMREKDKRYDKNVGLKIAKTIRPDFRKKKFKSFILKNNIIGEYYWDKASFNEDERYSSTTKRLLTNMKPCDVCFVPSVGPSITFKDHNMVVYYNCLRGHHVEFLKSYKRKCCTEYTCCCEDCAKKHNIILPEKINKK